MSKFLDKLKGRSLDELRVRGGQMLAARWERYGWSAQMHLPSDDELRSILNMTGMGPVATPDRLLEHFRKRDAPAFFAGFEDPPETLAELKRRWPQGHQSVARARRISEGRFDLLGFRDLNFGAPIDWHLEPASGKRAPSEHWSRINYLDVAVTGDKKIVWELNRHQHFMTLGQAYWYTGDELFAQTFVAHLETWMEQNPPKLGINWTSSLEIAFRSISWLWALYFFKNSPQLTPELFLRALKFLYLQARHLETYLSTYFGPNTHLTGEALGLFYLGTLLPEFRCAARWQQKGRDILLAELHRQVKPDGVYFEQSSYYHRYTTDFYIHFYVLAQLNGLQPGAHLKDKLTALLDHLMYITRPDGTVPFFGDDDGGRLVMLDQRPANDFRATLATGAALFGRSDYKYVAGEPSEETLWLLGATGLREFDAVPSQPPQQTSCAFTDGGYYVMRDGWTRQANYLLVNCGPHGVLGGAHAHADALAFDLAARGRTTLVDPGTYTYTGSPELRDYFRSSSAHNTVTVDGVSSSVASGPFRWQHMAQARPSAWLTHRRFDYFAGTHDGYVRLPDEVRHTRAILFMKGDYWIISDLLATKGTHRYDSHFHFLPGIAPTISGNSVAARSEAFEPGLQLFAFGSDGRWRIEDGWVSRCYGERAVAPVAIFSATAAGPQEFVTFLVPDGAGPKIEVCEDVDVIGGRAFNVLGEWRDQVVIGSGGLVETPLISSDFEWTWTRSGPGMTTPEELVLIGGRRLCLAGQELFRAGERVEYLNIHLAAETLIVETNARGEFMITQGGLTRAVVNGAEYSVHGADSLYFVGGQLQQGRVEAEAVKG